MAPRYLQQRADTSRMQRAQSRRTHDRRVREAILESGDRDLSAELEIPRSTIRSWIHRGLPGVVTSELVTCDRAALISEIHALRQRTAVLAGVVGLLMAMLRVSRDRLDYERFAEGQFEAALLRAIGRASKVLPLLSALRIACLSPSRYYKWRRPRWRIYPAKPKIVSAVSGRVGSLMTRRTS